MRFRDGRLTASGSEKASETYTKQCGLVAGQAAFSFAAEMNFAADFHGLTLIKEFRGSLPWQVHPDWRSLCVPLYLQEMRALSDNSLSPRNWATEIIWIYSVFSEGITRIHNSLVSTIAL